MSNFRCKHLLGNERYVQVTLWKGEPRVDIREWKDDSPTKKGISLTMMRWKNLVDQLDYVDKSLENRQPYERHFGGNVYCNVGEDSVCVDIRQYWKPEEKIVPTKKGICLRPSEYLALKELTQEIGEAMPELNSLVPCYLQSDHMNQVGALQCPECKPDDYENY